MFLAQGAAGTFGFALVELNIAMVHFKITLHEAFLGMPMKGTFTGLIKPRDHGRVVVDGIEYIKIYAWWERPILRMSWWIQKGLWLCGVAIHNPIAGECTPDFNCCCKGIGRKAWFRYNFKGRY